MPSSHASTMWRACYFCVPHPFSNLCFVWFPSLCGMSIPNTSILSEPKNHRQPRITKLFSSRSTLKEKWLTTRWVHLVVCKQINSITVQFFSPLFDTSQIQSHKLGLVSSWIHHQIVDINVQELEWKNVLTDKACISLDMAFMMRATPKIYVTRVERESLALPM